MPSVEPVQSQAVKDLLKYYKQIWALENASALLEWDRDTYMPRKAAEFRGKTKAEIKLLIKKLYTSKEFEELLKKAEKEASNDTEKGIVRILNWVLKFYKLPDKLIEEFEKTTSVAVVKWEEAKRKAKFEIFAPYLERIVELSREKAEKLGYKEHPYDALLDEFQEGWTKREVDRMFNELKSPLKREMERILNSGWPQSHWLENEPYDNEKMKLLNKVVLTYIGFDWDRMRLDVSAHPFTIGIEPEDVRITTWYHGKDFRRSLLAVIHEYGHALYELQVSPLLYETPIRGQNSLGIHESQSRFWENVLGRSREFVEKITPFVRDILGYEKVDAEEIFKYFNIVRPDLIRVEADEVTYNFHILIRYEIEVGLIEGSIEVKELPQIWNEKYEKYLGVTPKNDAEGVLQDIHWSFGAIGYFPTYTYGNLLAAQLKYTVPELREALEEGNPLKVKEVLKEKIHQFGSMYEPEKLVELVTGEKLNPQYFIKYIKEKYQ